MKSSKTTAIRFRITAGSPDLVTVYRETVTVEVFGTKPLDPEVETGDPASVEAYRKNLEDYFREPVAYEV